MVLKPEYYGIGYIDTIKDIKLVRYFAPPFVLTKFSFLEVQYIFPTPDIVPSRHFI